MNQHVPPVTPVLDQGSLIQPVTGLELLEDVLSSDPGLTERMIIMVSWNDLFTFIIMLMAILTYIDTHREHKK